VKNKISKQHQKIEIDHLSHDLLGGVWPGIQLYYPPVKYSPSSAVYEDLIDAAKRMKKHVINNLEQSVIKKRFANKRYN
jgi:hypothetical protein